MSLPQDRSYSPIHCEKGETSSLTDNSETSTDSDSSLLPPAPDGGYGWVIVFSSFAIMLISDGIAFSFGLLYNALLDEFEASKSVTSWVGSIFYGVPLLCGPIASAIATKYGCRKATMFGGIVAAVGFLISSQAKSIAMLCFFFGIIGGFGVSMGCVTSVVMVAFYFKKKRALATGLAVCGTGIGTFLFAPLMEYIINEYGWRGALIILSGIVLNIVVFGALYRPLKFTPEQKQRRALEAFEKKSCSLSKASLPSPSHPSRHNSETEESTDNNASTADHWSCSQIYLPTYTKDATVPESLFVTSRRNGSNLKQMIENYIIQVNSNSQSSVAKNADALMLTRSGKIAFVENQCKSASKAHLTNRKVEDSTCNSTVWKRHHKRKSRMQVVEYLPMCRKDLFYRGNLNRILSSYYRTTLLGSHYRTTSCPELFISTIDDDEDDFSDKGTNQCFKILRFSKQVTKVLRTMVDCSLFSNSLFMLYAVSNFILYFWYDVPYIFVIDQAIGNGISERNATFIISILGIVNTIGQVVCGLIGDQPINLSLFYGLSIILAGLSVLLVPLFTDYVSQCIMAAGFGLFISANYALSTVILVDFLSIDKLTNAYGLTMLMQGLANLLGPPVAGWLYDKTESYDATFYTGGAFIMFSGLMMVLVPIPEWTFRMCISQKSKSARPVEAAEHYPLTLRVTEVETSV